MCALKSAINIFSSLAPPSCLQNEHLCKSIRAEVSFLKILQKNNLVLAAQWISWTSELINKHETVFLQYSMFKVHLSFSPPVSSLHGKSSSTGNLLEREDVAASVPEYAVHSHMAAQSAASLHGRQQRPYSVVVPGFSQVGLRHNRDPQSHKAASTHCFHASHSAQFWRDPRLSHSQSFCVPWGKVTCESSVTVKMTDTHTDRHLWLSGRKEAAECLWPRVLSPTSHLEHVGGA